MRSHINKRFLIIPIKTKVQTMIIRIAKNQIFWIMIDMLNRQSTEITKTIFEAHCRMTQDSWRSCLLRDYSSLLIKLKAIQGSTPETPYDEKFQEAQFEQNSCNVGFIYLSLMFTKCSSCYITRTCSSCYITRTCSSSLESNCIVKIMFGTISIIWLIWQEWTICIETR